MDLLLPGSMITLMSTWNKRGSLTPDTWRDVKTQCTQRGGPGATAAIGSEDDDESELEYYSSPHNIQRKRSFSLESDDNEVFDTQQNYENQVRKRRHVDREMGGHMSHMSLNDTCKNIGTSTSTPIRDEDMSQRGSYEISPDRIYVHSLDEDDDGADDRAMQFEMRGWEVHPSLAKHLDAGDIRRQESLRLPRWISPRPHNAPCPPSSQSLVLWRPPLWEEIPEKLSDAEPMDI